MFRAFASESRGRTFIAPVPSADIETRPIGGRRYARYASLSLDDVNALHDPSIRRLCALIAAAELDFEKFRGTRDLHKKRRRFPPALAVIETERFELLSSIRLNQLSGLMKC